MNRLVVSALLLLVLSSNASAGSGSENSKQVYQKETKDCCNLLWELRREIKSLLPKRNSYDLAKNLESRKAEVAIKPEEIGVDDRVQKVYLPFDQLSWVREVKRRRERRYRKMDQKLEACMESTLSRKDDHHAKRLSFQGCSHICGAPPEVKDPLSVSGYCACCAKN